MSNAARAVAILVKSLVLPPVMYTTFSLGRTSMTAEPRSLLHAELMQNADMATIQREWFM